MNKFTKRKNDKKNENKNRSGLLLHLAYISFLSPTKDKLYEIKCDPTRFGDPLWRGLFHTHFPSILQSFSVK